MIPVLSAIKIHEIREFRFHGLEEITYLKLNSGSDEEK